VHHCMGFLRHPIAEGAWKILAQSPCE